MIDRQNTEWGRRRAYSTARKVTDGLGGGSTQGGHSQSDVVKLHAD